VIRPMWVGVSDLILCLSEIDCGSAPKVSGATFNSNTSTIFGGVARYTCDNDDLLYEKTCIEDGEWDGDVCKGKYPGNNLRACWLYSLVNNPDSLQSGADRSKSDISCCAARCAQIWHDTRPVMHIAYANFARNICVTCSRFTRHIRESDANVARTCRTRSAQQGMLLLDPTVCHL
jgi:hypothetical protein